MRSTMNLFLKPQTTWRKQKIDFQKNVTFSIFPFLPISSSYIINQEKRQKTCEPHFSMNILLASYVAVCVMVLCTAQGHMASPLCPMASPLNISLLQLFKKIEIGWCFAWQIDHCSDSSETFVPYSPSHIWIWVPTQAQKLHVSECVCIIIYRKRI